LHNGGTPAAAAAGDQPEGASMAHAWVVLTTLDGRDTLDPGDGQLAAALADVYAAGGEGSATLRFGYDDGLMYVAEVNGAGDISFEEWSDRDCEMALAAPRRMHATRDQALQLWCWLAHRQVSRIRELGWS
jgi:hypothetical protein